MIVLNFFIVVGYTRDRFKKEKSKLKQSRLRYTDF